MDPKPLITHRTNVKWRWKHGWRRVLQQKEGAGRKRGR